MYYYVAVPSAPGQQGYGGPGPQLESDSASFPAAPIY